MTKLNNVSNMEKVYRIYFEEVVKNEEIGTVENLDCAQEIIKNDILERGFNSSDIETYQDDYIIVEEVKYNSNDTIDYVNEYLLDCETNQQDMLVNVKGYMEDIEIVDVIGIVEEKGRIYVGLEVEYNEYCYLVNVSFMNTWDFVYKDEMIEIQDKLQSLVSSQLKSDLGIKGNMLEDVQFWLKENDENGTIDHKEILNELMYNGVENMAPSHLIYNDDIQAYYKEHKDQINNIIEYEVGYTIDDAIDDIQAFETITNNIGGIDSELSFEDGHELENSELRFFVWLAFEIVAYDYLKSLEDK